MWLAIVFVISSLTYGTNAETKEHVTCNRSDEFQKIGCFHTRLGSNNREDFDAMKMLLTDRDKSSPYYSGYFLNWREFDKSTHSLVCRCARKAREEGYTYISLRFWGECHAGKDFNALTPSLKDRNWRSTNCKNPRFGGCTDSHEDECVGEAAADYIYRVSTGSSAAEKVDGGLSEWSEWSACHATCGTSSIAERERTCTNPVPQGDGASCEGELSETKQCATVECPIDGGLSTWGPYDVCSVTCGGGVATRSRSCTNPAPASGGKECTGPIEETNACSTAPCPVDGGYGQWSSYGECSATCSDGVQTRSRACNSPAQAHGGSGCEELGDKEESQTCKVKECPIDGKLGSWSIFSPCTKSCGGGTRARVRTCNNPPAQHDGKVCTGETQEVEDCNTDPCPVDGGFSKWSDFVDCTTKCGGGSQTKTRTCTSPAPQHGGKECSGPTTMSATCNTHQCPVNGQYGRWSDWSKCTKVCGSGSQSRTRSCNNPAPAHGGTGCVGLSSETQVCNTKHCSVDGKWSAFSPYGPCTKKCGGGIQIKIKTCTNPAPAYGGKACVGSNTMIKVCNTQSCPVDGKWSAFSPYGPCTKKCGGGIQIKMKTCTNPAPAYGGKACVGSNTMIKVCNTQSCPG